MPSRKFFVGIALGAAAFCLFFITLSTAAGQTYAVLHNFKTKEGSSPLLGLVFDSSGDLYGVASQEGSARAGSVFELTPSGSSWTEKTLHAFNGSSDGSTPASPVTFDSAGNLYGATKLGGTNGVGVVYELIKSKAGTWSETVLHNFGGSKDGQYPTNALVFDSAGNLYGTTEGGGSHGNGQEITGGTVYKLSPKSGGGWTETILYNLGKGTDGASPRCNLLFDSSGNLYGTTFYGGTNAAGTVFELSPPKTGTTWTEKILHNFLAHSGDGAYPAAGVVLDNSGNLFGTATTGDPFTQNVGGGVVFELSPSSGGGWTETTIYGGVMVLLTPSFIYSGLAMDSSENLYFANAAVYGSVVELQKVDSWGAKTLYNFEGTHGSKPALGSLIFDSSGNLYGAAQSGGANSSGVVFKITP